MKKPTKKTAKRKVKGGKRRTTDRVSRIASKWLTHIREVKRRNDKVTRDWSLWVPLVDVAAMAGSLIGQDEHRGKRK
jgi:hypothetical protein